MPNEHSHVIGGSSAERIMNCPGSVALSADVPNRSTKAADTGTMLHDVIAEEVAGETVKYGWAHENGEKYTQEHNWEAIQPALGHLAQLEEVFGEMEIFIEDRVQIESVEGAFGTQDIFGYNAKYVLGLDWKFGFKPVNAKGNYQIRFYMLGERYKNPKLFEDKKIIIAISQPYAEREEDQFSYEVIDNAELDRFEDQMLEALEQTHLKKGSWCTFCRADFKCPEKTGTAKKLSDAAKGREVAEVIDDGEHTLEELLEIAEVLKPWVAKVYKEAQHRLEEGNGVDGWKLVPKRGTRVWNDPELTAKRLKGRKHLVDDTHEPRKLKSPAQVEKMLKAKKKDIKFLEEYVSKVSSGHTMARDDDPRPNAAVGNGVASKLAAAKTKSE